MFRLLFSLVFSVTLARWSYDEIKLVAPYLIPSIDAAIARIQIPTHDQWSTSLLARLLAESQVATGSQKNTDAKAKSDGIGKKDLAMQAQSQLACQSEQERTALNGIVAIAARAFEKY